MKRIISAICLGTLIAVMAASTCFAGAKLSYESYPYDGMENTTKENMCVKLKFSGDVDSKSVQKSNEKCFSITTKDGKKKVPLRVFVNPEDPKQVLVLADATKNLNMIKDDTRYVLHISGDFKDNNGNTLGEDSTVEFKTMNQGRSTKIYMLMMVVMFAGIFFLSSRQMRKRAREQMMENQEIKEEAFNPYKEAKRTGKSVEEVMAQHEKEVAKRDARAAKKAAKAEKDDIEESEYYAPGHYGVKGPRPIAPAGGKYKTGRKALAEAMQAEEEKRKASTAGQKKRK